MLNILPALRKELAIVRSSAVSRDTWRPHHALAAASPRPSAQKVAKIMVAKKVAAKAKAPAKKAAAKKAVAKKAA